LGGLNEFVADTPSHGLEGLGFDAQRFLGQSDGSLGVDAVGGACDHPQIIRYPQAIMIRF
jgi:hypothetical protein